MGTVPTQQVARNWFDSPDFDFDDDDDDNDDDIYIMVKCLSVCLYVTFLLILSSPAKLLIYI